MKKILVISIFGILVGCIFAYIMFSNIKDEVSTVVSNDTKVTAFQIGVFSIYDNAIKIQNEHSYSYIYEDDDKYRVFIAIFKDPEIISLMQRYYQKKDINIYLKEINATTSFIKELTKYEELLKESNNIETYLMANKNILKTFGDTL